MIELSKIRIDGGTQPRAELNQATVDEYAEAIKAGAGLPPVTLFFDGSDFWLADGFHRYFGAKAAGKTSIHEDITPGTLRDAILYSLSANSKHGLRRSNADKRRAVQTLLDDPEWCKWSDSEIARRCAVGADMVAHARKPIIRSTDDSEPQTRTVTRNGKTYEQKKKAGGKKEDSEDGKPKKPVLLTEEKSAKVLAAAEKAKAAAEKSKAEAEAAKAECERMREAAEMAAKDSEETLADNESMAKIFEADDKLAAAAAEIKRLRAEVDSQKWQIIGAINKGNETLRRLKACQARCEKLEKRLKEAGIES